jgi:hypothetical protein
MAGGLLHFKKDHVQYSIKPEDYATMPLFVASRKNLLLNEFCLRAGRSSRQPGPRSGAVANPDFGDVAIRGRVIHNFNAERRTHVIHNFSPLLASAKLACASGYTHIETIYPKLCDLTSETDDKRHVSQSL